MLWLGSVLPGIKARSGMNPPIGTFMKRLLSINHTEQFWSCAAAPFVMASHASPAIASAPRSAIRRTRFLTVFLLSWLVVAPKSVSMRLVLARPEHILDFEEVLGCALAHGLRVKQVFDLPVSRDLCHLRRRGLVKLERLQILVVHLVHR